MQSSITRNCGACPWLYEITFSKSKMSELYPQFPHNILNCYTSWIYIYIWNLLQTDFGMITPRWHSWKQQGGKNLEIDYGKNPTLSHMWSRIFCVYHRKRMRHDDFLNVWSDVYSRRMPALMTSYMIILPQRSFSEALQFVFLNIHAAVREVKEVPGDGLWFKCFLVYYETDTRMLTECLEVYPYYILIHRTYFESIIYNILLK